METNIKQRCGNRHKERDKSGKKRRSIRRRKKGIGDRTRCAKAHGTREGTPYSLSPHRTDPRKLSFLGIRLRRVHEQFRFLRLVHTRHEQFNLWRFFRNAGCTAASLSFRALRDSTPFVTDSDAPHLLWHRDAGHFPQKRALTKIPHLRNV